jgi:hypothetical protein
MAKQSFGDGLDYAGRLSSLRNAQEPGTPSWIPSFLRGLDSSGPTLPATFAALVSLGIPAGPLGELYAQTAAGNREGDVVRALLEAFAANDEQGDSLLSRHTRRAMLHLFASSDECAKLRADVCALVDAWYSPRTPRPAMIVD